MKTLVDEARIQLRGELGKALQIGAKAWAAQSNSALESVRGRLDRLEERAASQAAPNKQRKR